MVKNNQTMFIDIYPTYSAFLTHIDIGIISPKNNIDIVATSPPTTPPAIWSKNIAKALLTATLPNRRVTSKRLSFFLIGSIFSAY